jgi:hypothetical protein
MKIHVYDKQEKRWIKIEALKFDHLGEGRPVIVVFDGQEWALGSRFEIKVTYDDAEV